jgi:AcrR family transcriptional regulator
MLAASSFRRIIISVELKKRNSDYHHGNLRDALIQCGLELIEEQGIHVLTLREIGKRLGVSRSAAYAHFRDKEALIACIRQAAFLQFGDTLEAAANSATGFATKMDAMSVAYFGFAREHRAQFEVMSKALIEAGAAQTGRVFTLLRGIIQEAQEEGEVRPGDPSQLARVVWCLAHGVSTLQRDGTESNFIRFSAEILRYGLLASR